MRVFNSMNSRASETSGKLDVRQVAWTSLFNQWKGNFTNSTDREIPSVTSSAGYTKIIYKPTHVIFNSMLCIDFIFCTSRNVISKYGVDFSIFDKAITISSMARLTSEYPSHQYMSVKYGITVKQMFKILKNLLKTSIGE